MKIIRIIIISKAVMAHGMDLGDFGLRDIGAMPLGFPLCFGLFGE